MKYPISEINRREIPAIEKHGCIGFILDSEPRFIIFQAGSVRIENMECVQVAENLVFDTNRVNCVCVGSYLNNLINIFDIVMVNGKSIRNKKWQERLAYLDVFYNGLLELSTGRIVMAKTIKRGLTGFANAGTNSLAIFAEDSDKIYFFKKEEK